MRHKNTFSILWVVGLLTICCFALSTTPLIHAQVPPIETKGEFLKYNDVTLILRNPLIEEKCWHCHQDFYPDLAPNPNSPSHLNVSCFTNPNGLPYPLYYSTLDFIPNQKFQGFNPSQNFTNPLIYAPRKKGHLSHLVYQPFGLGRWCLDCHDPGRYDQGDPNTPHSSDGHVYFKDGNTLNQTSICKDCHGGFYPEGSIASIIVSDPNAVKILKWGDSSTVSCLHCHDDSQENGGSYASYISRYSSDDSEIIYDPNHTHFYHDWSYSDTNGCLITAPDPDKIPGQNYWSKNGHGVKAESQYTGATLDTGYPDPNRPNRTYPNQGAMNSQNIPSGKHSNAHDMNLDPNDGKKNFCWECHWSNRTTKRKICATSYEYTSGLPIGKYNGHLDTIDYRDERWGDPNELSTALHHQWKECRECHPTKYSHFVYKASFTGRRKPVPLPRASHCIVCHNPHGSGDDNGNANAFMIKKRIYKQSCNNCHFSQFKAAPCSPYPPPDEIGSPYPDPNEDVWIVDFLNPLKQDILEPDSFRNADSIPPSTTDICEICHQTKDRLTWTTPKNVPDYQPHQNGALHYFNPDPMPCTDPNICYIDYRGTDCTGCHIHDPGPVPESQAEIENSLSNFNSKAFAPTCRCHGIQRIDIETFKDDEGNDLRDIILGKGHGTPPPPFPDGDASQDPHMAHTRYNYPCLRCHIDPNGPSYDNPEDDYIFELDNHTPVGFDPFLNPNGIYNAGSYTCSNLYCHSNGKGVYSDPIIWSEVEMFCRDPLTCLDTDGHFIYCDNCHQTPPDQTGTDHSNASTSCMLCHPHNGVYEGKPGFYDHVNGAVEANLCEGTPSEINTRCLDCHQDTIDDPDPDFGCNSDKAWVHAVDSSCTICHGAVCSTLQHSQYQGTLPLDITQDWSQQTGCGACHHEQYLTDATQRADFQKTRSIHDKLDPAIACNVCHQRHCAVRDIDQALCMICHTPEEDVQVGSVYLHNRYNLGEGLTCVDCHSTSHVEGEMTFTEADTRQEMEQKCKACHTDANLDRIQVSCDLPGQKVHTARANCLGCHDVYTEEGAIFRIIKGHYTMPSQLGKMEPAWTDQGDGISGNECGACHGEDQQNPLDPSKRLHDLILSPCNSCHGKHCDMNIEPAWQGAGTCGGCHTQGDIQLPSGAFLHSGITAGVSCLECHENHRSAASLHSYLSDSKKCGGCHGSPPVINVVCNGIPVSGLHPPEATNCQTCHPGVYAGTNKHYLNAGPLNVVQSWEGANSCGGCHIDQPVVACGGGPLSIHASLGPSSDCAQCHGGHCDMVYGDTPGKCIACHSPNPTICDICGPGSITSHYAFDTMGVNQAAIQDCLSCHVEPLGGGEANPVEHINNPQTFVKEGACLGCHSLARIRHGPTDTLGCYACHPVHCVTEYARNDACIWCHTINPPIVDICQLGLGITSHMAFDSSAFNQIQVTNCIGCHMEPVTGGETNPINHIDDPWTYVNPLTCIGCHTVVVPHGGSGLPWQGGLWPAVNCYSCHPKHCFSIYCDNQACIWCHSPTPPLLNVCGIPGLTPHGGDCIGCHAAGTPTGGECNPVDHMNGITFVRDGTCLNCHPTVTATHSPGTQACLLCHPVHCAFTYCSEPQCKACHTQPAFNIVSDYGCPVGIHDAPAYKECNRCHVGECNPQNHTLGPLNLGMPTDLSGMRMDWMDCGLCHQEAQLFHAPCNAPCTLCHAGASPHACLDLDYCAENKCKCCHASPTFPIQSDYGCGVGPHAPAAYIDCRICHVNECNPFNHMDTMTDVSNMPLDWPTCGLCHMDAQALHMPCNQPCTACHSGTGTHACLDLNYCSEPQCKCCHVEPVFPIQSDYGCGMGMHEAGAYINCTLCHIGECIPPNHIDGLTDVSNMALDWLTCGLCHADAQALHVNCPEPCNVCHSGAGNHSCLELNYCAELKCKCCHIQPVFPIVSDYGCGTGTHPATAFVDCTMCHIGECNPLNHVDMLTDVSNMPLDWIACGLCHADAQVLHANCPQPCTVCHMGSSNHSCLELDYCAETKCKCCHIQPVFPISSDYGCGIGTHPATAFVDCTMCHIGECNPLNHVDTLTDVSNMPLDWNACGLCHAAAQAYHVPCNQPCTACHTGTGTHACLDLNYCTEPQCKCCHAQPVFPINSDYGCGIGNHAAGAYVECTMCHIEECGAPNHMDTLTDVSNMPLDWIACGLCHVDAQAIHERCPEQCIICHIGTSNHSCLELDYCSESICKCCHAEPVFPINSDYGCGAGLHAGEAYIDCTICHIEECLSANHLDGMTDVSNMPLEWGTCGLCHVDAQASHVNCPEPCTLCHSGAGNHSCLELDYCAELKCKCCHINSTFPINSDYGCGVGTHAAAAYVDCTMCHIEECVATNHLDTTTNVSNMPLDWTACGLCHADAQAIHVNCLEPCNICHVGTSNHSCLELDYCAELKCKCCHVQDTFTVNSDYGCGTGVHAATAYVDCTMCHIGECQAGSHLDTLTDVSNMPLDWTACGLCHPDAQATHANCPEPCTFCHSGTSTHACVDLNYCSDQKCRCCHINVPFHNNTQCDCATCHSAECDPLEHDITGVSTNHPMDPAFYNYTGSSTSVGCTCCHGYPPQALCVGISDTQDHCLDLVNGCSPEIFECMPCHTLFNGQPNHISIPYTTPAIIASCACHGDTLGTTAAHGKHLTTPVMVPVYGTGNVIDCQACHSATTNLADHVVCIPGAAVTAPVQFDATLPMIGAFDSYTPGATPGTGSCNLYCHSDGDEDPLDVPGIYTYFLGAPPFWNQTTGIVSCGNAALGTTAASIYQCHGYPPPVGHPGGPAGVGAQNCTNCHPTPLLGTVPNSTFHINGAVDIASPGPGVGPGVGGGIPVI